MRCDCSLSVDVCELVSGSTVLPSASEGREVSRETWRRTGVVRPSWEGGGMVEVGVGGLLAAGPVVVLLLVLSCYTHTDRTTPSHSVACKILSNLTLCTIMYRRM